MRLVLNLLALGVDASAIEEAVNIREATLRTWLCRSGVQGRKLHQRFLVILDLVHIQLDELHPALRALAVWANVKRSTQDMWGWTTCDVTTKIIPVIQVGGRTQEMAFHIVHQLKGRLRSGCVPVFSTDGLRHYFYTSVHSRVL